MEEEKVHSCNLLTLVKNEYNNEDVADEDEDGHAAVDGYLHSLTTASAGDLFTVISLITITITKTVVVLGDLVIRSLRGLHMVTLQLFITLINL